MTIDGTGAALLAAIRAHPLEPDPRLRFLDWAADHLDAIRAAVERAMAAVPLLTDEGVGVFGWWPRQRTPPAPHDPAAARFRAARDRLRGATTGFAAATAWLVAKPCRGTVSQHRNSFSYAREVERDFAAAGHRVIVTNGELVAAAVAAGVAWRPAWGGGPNALLGLSQRLPRPRSSAPTVAASVAASCRPR